MNWNTLTINLTRPDAEVVRQIRAWWSGRRGANAARERTFAQIRRERGWSRQYAADLLGISGGYLGRLERGAAPLTMALGERMAGLYEVDLNRLVSRR